MHPVWNRARRRCHVLSHLRHCVRDQTGRGADPTPRAQSAECHTASLHRCRGGTRDRDGPSAAGYQVWKAGSDAATAVAPAAPAGPPPATESLVQLAEEAETLARNQAEMTVAMQDAIARYQTRSGGALPAGIGAELTPEQRALLTERLKTERMGTASLLQDLLARDQQLREMRQRLETINKQLPYAVTATEGQRHERIAMDYLTQQGLGTEAAYGLVSQASLTEPLMAGFRVFLLYRDGQFATWVTQGSASTSPRAVRERLAQMAAEERDAALGALDATRADRDDLRNLANLADKSLQDTQADLRAMTAAAERGQAGLAAVRYLVGSKSELVRGKVIDGSYRLLPVRTDGTEFVPSASSALPPIDPSWSGLRRINRVRVLPGTVAEGEDFQVNNVDGFVSVAILRPERFAQYAKFFVIVLE